MNTDQFIEKHGIKTTFKSVSTNPNMGGGMPAGSYHWYVTFRLNGRQFSTYFSAGPGWDPDDVTPGVVLEAVRSDTWGVVDQVHSTTPVPDIINQGWEAYRWWCGDFGYDAWDDEPQAIYKSCIKSGRRLLNLLGADLFQELLEEVEPE